MEPVTWAAVAVAIAAAGRSPWRLRWTSPDRPDLVSSLALGAVTAAIAGLGSGLVPGWWPSGVAASLLGALVAVSSRFEQRPSPSSADPGGALLTAAWSGAVGSAARALMGLTATVMVAMNWPGTADPAAVVAAFGAGVTCAAAVLAGGDARRRAASHGPIVPLLAIGVAAPAALAVVLADPGDPLVLALPAAGLLAIVITGLVIRGGDGAEVLRRRGVVVALAVAGAGFIAAAGSGAGTVLRLGGAVTVGALLAPVAALAADAFTSDHWRPAKRVAARSRSGAVEVVVTGLGDAARAGALLVGITASGLAVAHGLAAVPGVALAAAGFAATVTVQGAALRFAVATQRVAIDGEEVTPTREVVDGVVAAGSAAAAPAAVVVVVAAGLAASGAVAALWSLVPAMRTPGVGGLLTGAAAGIGGVWFAVGWMVHTREELVPAAGRRHPAPPRRWLEVGLRIAPTAVVAVVPVVLGHTHPSALAGYLIGLVGGGLTGVAVPIVAAGSWENVRRLVETGAYGGPGSRAHRATVVADSIGEVIRSAVVPAVIALVLATAFVAVALAPAFG